MKEVASLDYSMETLDIAEPIRHLLDRVWEEYWRDSERAALRAEKALTLAREYGDRVAEIESLAALSLCLSERADRSGAESSAGEAMRLLLDATPAAGVPDRVRMQTSYSLAVALAIQARFQEAQPYFEDAREAARRCGDRAREADAAAGIGQMYHGRGDFHRALEYFTQSLTIAREIGYQFGESSALGRMGGAYDRLGDYSSAIEAHLQSLALRQEIGDRHGEVGVYNNIGNVHIQLEEYALARSFYERGMDLSRELGLVEDEARLLGNIALSYQGEENWSESIRYHHESLTLKEELGARQGIINTLGNLGELLIEIGRCTEAEDCLIRALDGNREIGDRHGETHCLLALGQLYAPDKGANGSCDERDLDYLNAALRQAREIGSPELEYNAHEGLMKAYRARGDFERALLHFEQFHKIKESVFTERMAQRTRTLQVLHEVEQARKEAEIHRLRTVELTDALAEADRQRTIAERLAREDALTGLLTRRYGENRLAEAFTRARRAHCPLTVALADIDHFKVINDTCSHQAGDAVLKVIGALLRENCRGTDILARLGGEEFLIALPDTDADDARALCEHIRATVETYDWGRVHPGLQVTLSIGLCSDTSLSGHEKMLSVADARLYAAKNAGRNCVAAP